ncbi:hypothetical protein ACROYT_G011023 [Oculina patagonica]
MFVLFSSQLEITKRSHSLKLTNDLKRLAVELSETQRSLIHSPLHFYRVGRNIEVVHGMIKSLGGNLVDDDKSYFVRDSSSSTSARKKEVCPEKFMGNDSLYGYPFYRKGFERVNCTEFVPIDQLVTIIVTSPEERLPEEQHQVFQGIAKYYPNIPITLLSKRKPTLAGLTNLKLNLKDFVSEDLAHGETWSKLLQEVTTPFIYVLFAPDITHFTDDTNIERLVRVLSENEDMIVAGGSHKNLRGEWDKDCLQVTFKNWTAYFRGGYYHSFNDCIVCDVIPGPFMGKTKELKQVGIDERLPFGVFQDLFWRLKLKHPEKVVVSCPDVMFNTYEREIPDHKYAALSQKWDVKKWVDSNGRVRWYGCRGGHNHDNTSSCSRQTGLAVPPCDLENLADAIKFIMKECEDAGVYCELNEGSVLGAVKFNKILPWERDADIKFLSENYTAIQKLRPKFEAAGFEFVDERGTECCTDGRKIWGIFLLYKNGWKVDMYGKAMLESELLVASGQRPTKVMLAGQWVTAMRNPGLSARNRYGPNIYRHVEHWYDIGYSYGHVPYKSGIFTRCPEPGHSGCLDQFPPDGNLQFSDYPFI